VFGTTLLDSSQYSNDITLFGSIGAGGFAQSQVPMSFIGKAGATIKLEFSTNTSNTEQTLFEAADLEGSNVLTAGINADNRMYVTSVRPDTTQTLFVAPAAVSTNTMYKYVIMCGAYLSFCYII
jgi:hypothetical protein